ncbi:metallophosphoesterase family protein [Snuella lapsa]|uniref:Calcineurin-like phosphoesterase domain-containing protein n=1 Tax=Snuella lapsa TaxID=870481 RepID=A0ABP6YF01_9FLAO
MTKRTKTSRREFIKLSSLAGAAMVLPIDGFSNSLGRENIEIGIIADVHQDVIHDGVERLRVFLDEAKKRHPDFIIQMGDFALPNKENQPFLDTWNAYKGDKYHVLGNHDMRDHGFTREQTMTWWDMNERYYSFDKKGVHFIVLDGNDPNPKPWSGYDRYIGEEQKNWLIQDLQNTNKPTIVFSHQTLQLEYDGVANMKEIRGILEDANKKAGFKKVMCCLSGHTHTDYMTHINGIYYLQINSASYRWVGGDYKTIRYSEAIDKTHKWIKYTIPYKESLFTFMNIKNNKIIVEPRKTVFVGPGPDELGMPEQRLDDPIVPSISGFKMKI